MKRPPYPTLTLPYISPPLNPYSNVTKHMIGLTPIPHFMLDLHSCISHQIMISSSKLYRLFGGEMSGSLQKALIRKKGLKKKPYNT